MIRGIRQPDVQWIRALGAVAIGLVMIHGAMEVGRARAHGSRPASQLAAAAYCVAVAALRGAPAQSSGRDY